MSKPLLENLPSSTAKDFSDDFLLVQGEFFFTSNSFNEVGNGDCRDAGEVFQIQAAFSNGPDEFYAGLYCHDTS
ncbi:MAG: hypothetical protein HF981_00450 [Desulfobacteraceae bacterium]|nr:hypothetical protein [Desulfobacteraceae bacterium]MBC2748838.1 hypothetical protein [Desulfobacteraceae bacterium]